MSAQIDVRPTVARAVALTLAAGSMAERLAEASNAAGIYATAATDYGRAAYRKACRARQRRRRALWRILDALERLALDGAR